MTKKVTVVTGPLRSGTSCVTGMLELCGLDLGKNIRVLRNPTEYNPKGHFEHDLLFTVNERLIFESCEGAGVFSVPHEKHIADIAGRRSNYFNMFIKRFDGDLCKDPLFCITLRHWEEYWPELGRAVFCLRHPEAVARSMHKRYGIPIIEGFRLWETYTRRFFYTQRKTSFYVFDFDAFTQKSMDVFSGLIDWLELKPGKVNLQRHIDDFFLPKHSAWNSDEEESIDMPEDVKDLYNDIKKLAGKGHV